MTAAKSPTSENVLNENWPADRVERWPIEDLIPYARNARRHPDEQVEQIAASIRQFGFTIPILAAEDGTIVAGHGRVLAAQRLGLAEVPVMVARGWTHEQRRAYTIADNRLAETSDWDDDLLRLELGELRDLGVEISDLGFGQEDLDKLFADEAAPASAAEALNVSLADRFGVPLFSVLNAREGWWQDRKRAWLALGIRSELGRGEGVDGGASPGGSPRPLDRMKNAKRANATPGGSAMPAANYGKTKARGDGRGRAIDG